METLQLISLPIQASTYQSIPCFPRFQWLNHPKITEILSRFLQPSQKGRKGYDKVLMFRFLIWKQVMRCSYRDLEGISGGIDYSTFIKFRKRLIRSLWFPRIFKKLTNWVISQAKSLFLLLDSSFVESYSKRKERGAEYSGFKEKTGFKLHSLIDFESRLPLRQLSTGGAIMKDDVSQIPELVKIGRSALKVIRQNILLWEILNVLGFFLVFIHVLNPSGAAAYNFVSDFIPIFNSLRLFR